MRVCAFIGLGVMGFPMAGHLAARGYKVRVYNRSPSKIESWLKHHSGSAHSNPCEAAQGADIVFTCVGDDKDVQAVSMGEAGAFHGMKKGALFVDHSTVSANIARALSVEAQKRGFGFMDAPVSGGQAGAENATLSVMCGGTEENFEQAKTAIESYASSCRLMGAVGAGQLTKMVNQICIAGLLQGLAEAMNFGQKAGLDMEAVLAVISKGAAGSWQMENRGASMCQNSFDFGFAIDWMRKDLRIVFDEAKNNGALLPVTTLVDQFYAEVQKLGGGRQDTSALMRRLTQYE